MNVVKNYRQGLVVGETDKSYRVQPLSEYRVWWPKSQTKIDHDYYGSQLAIHLWIGYGGVSTIAAVEYLSKFVPALILADRKLDRQIEAGRDDWNKVFFYDVVQAAGTWLAANPTASVAEFTAKLEELIA